jgi:hypothetical protein
MRLDCSLRQRGSAILFKSRVRIRLSKAAISYATIQTIARCSSYKTLGIIFQIFLIQIINHWPIQVLISVNGPSKYI